MLHAVFHIDGITRFFQGTDALAQMFLILIGYGWRDQVKAVCCQLFRGFVAENLERGPVDVDNARILQTMIHYAAVDGGKDCFQRLVFADDFLLICALLRHVNAYADSSHDSAVPVIQGGLVAHKCSHLFPGFDGFLGYQCLSCAHDLMLRFDAGGIVLLHIPDIGVPAALYLLLGLVDRLTEAVVYFFMDAVLILVPHQIGNVIDRCFKKVAGFPEIPAHLYGLLPP